MLKDVVKSKSILCMCFNPKIRTIKKKKSLCITCIVNNDDCMFIIIKNKIYIIINEKNILYSYLHNNINNTIYNTIYIILIILFYNNFSFLIFIFSI